MLLSCAPPRPASLARAALPRALRSAPAVGPCKTFDVHNLQLTSTFPLSLVSRRRARLMRARPRHRAGSASTSASEAPASIVWRQNGVKVEFDHHVRLRQKCAQNGLRFATATVRRVDSKRPARRLHPSDTASSGVNVNFSQRWLIQYRQSSTLLAGKHANQWINTSPPRGERGVLRVRAPLRFFLFACGSVWVLEPRPHSPLGFARDISAPPSAFGKGSLKRAAYP